MVAQTASLNIAAILWNSTTHAKQQTIYDLHIHPVKHWNGFIDLIDKSWVSLIVFKYFEEKTINEMLHK
jgi:hypothetical protein